MMQYDGDLKLPAKFLVPPPAINGTSGELLAKNGVSTFACSETQKFGHVRLCYRRIQLLNRESQVQLAGSRGFSTEQGVSCKIKELLHFQLAFK